MSILTEPRNALVRQYQKLFEMEGVELRFTEAATRAIARKAIKRETGARGLRSIVEEIMLDLLYDLPTKSSDISECVIDEDFIEGKGEPLYMYREDVPRLHAG